MDDIFSDISDEQNKDDANIEWKKSGIDKHERLVFFEQCVVVLDAFVVIAHVVVGCPDNLVVSDVFGVVA